eukprot:9388825-Ditylum_brightwellii.AAC.1
MRQTRASTKKAAEAKKADSKEATTSSPAPVLRRLTRRNPSISRPPQRSTGGKEKKKDTKKGR